MSSLKTSSFAEVVGGSHARVRVVIATISNPRSLNGAGPDSDSADYRSTATTNSSSQSAALSLLDKLRATR